VRQHREANLLEIPRVFVRLGHVALADLRICASFRVTSGRALRTIYMSKEKKWKSMKDQDSANIVITFLLVLPWLARAVVSTMAVWRAHRYDQSRLVRGL
jgi:hypothetical protein